MLSGNESRHWSPNYSRGGVAFIEQVIFPSLEMLKRMQEEEKILAGGAMSGTVGLAMMVEAGSALELDEIIESLPIWLRTKTNVTPFTTWEGRIKTIRCLGDFIANLHK